MSQSLRFLLLLTLGVLVWGADLLCAQGPPPLPMPTPPRPNNTPLAGLAASFANAGTTNTQPINTQPIQTPRQNNHFSEPIPQSQSVNLTSFTTYPLPSSAVPKELHSEETPEYPLYSEEKENEYTDRYAALNRPLGGRSGDFRDKKGETDTSGLKNKLAMPNFEPIISVGGTLLIVIAAFFLLVIFLRKVSPQSNRVLPKEAFECLGRYSLTQKHQVQLLRLGNRIVLISVMPDSVSTLAEVTDPDEAVGLLGLCRRLDSNSATEMFRKTIASMSEEELSRPAQRPIVTTHRRGQPAASFEAFCEPEESLAAILARGRQYGR